MAIFGMNSPKILADDVCCKFKMHWGKEEKMMKNENVLPLTSQYLLVYSTFIKYLKIKPHIVVDSVMTLILL